MSENHQSENFGDELLSAYVDGELADAELAQVERRLADDPRAQQLVDELRALHRQVQSLPQETVGEDLRATIVQRAERVMLLGTDEQSALSPGETRGGRRWLWATLALAATLLLAAYLPNDGREAEHVADAQPAPDEVPHSDMRLEAVTSADDIANEVSESEGQLSGDRSAAVVDADEESVGEAVAAAPFRRRAVMSPAGEVGGEADDETLADANPYVCEVRLTLSEGENRFEQFDQLLLTNGIALENVDEKRAQKGGGLGGRFANKRRQSRGLKDGQEAVQEEVVVVEAPAEQIENVLVGCNVDTRNFVEVQVTEQQPSKAPVGQWLQYARSGKQVVQSKLQTLKQAKQSANRSLQGRAMRLDAGQYQYRADGKLQYSGKQGAMLSKSASSAKAITQPPVQVLFILQQAPVPPGKPASAGPGDPPEP